MRRWIAGLVVLGAAFPLTGATIVLVWIADQLVFRHMGQRVA